MTLNLQSENCVEISSYMDFLHSRIDLFWLAHTIFGEPACDIVATRYTVITDIIYGRLSHEHNDVCYVQCHCTRVFELAHSYNVVELIVYS